MQGRDDPAEQQRGLSRVIVAVVEVGPLVLDDLGVGDGLGPGVLPVTHINRAANAVGVTVSGRGVEGSQVGEVCGIEDQTGLLPGLPDGGLERGLAGLDLATGKDDVTGSPFSDVETGSPSHQAHGGEVEDHLVRVSILRDHPTELPRSGPDQACTRFHLDFLAAPWGDRQVSAPRRRRDLSPARTLTPRLVGAIGTGLFYGAADSISAAGPAIVISYLVGGAVIYLIMRALGEMSVHHPTSGAFSEYAHRWWGDLPGFISGWNYWFNYIFVSMAELSVVGIYVNYWFPAVPRWLSAAVLLVIVTTVNLLHVRAYGEVEFWFAIIKVVAIVAMIILGLWIILLGSPPTPATGFSNMWRNGGFMPYGVTGMLAGIIIVMFSFGGTELIGITAGEAEDPQCSIPKAINRVVGRILIFYVGALVVMLAIVPWTKIDGTASPFVQIFDLVGIPGAAAILNLVVLTAAMSAYNSGLYANGRLTVCCCTPWPTRVTPPRFSARSTGPAPRGSVCWSPAR